MLHLMTEAAIDGNSCAVLVPYIFGAFPLLAGIGKVLVGGKPV